MKNDIAQNTEELKILDLSPLTIYSLYRKGNYNCQNLNRIMNHFFNFYVSCIVSYCVL